MASFGVRTIIIELLLFKSSLSESNRRFSPDFNSKLKCYRPDVTTNFDLKPFISEEGQLKHSVMGDMAHENRFQVHKALMEPYDPLNVTEVEKMTKDFYMSKPFFCHLYFLYIQQ